MKVYLFCVQVNARAKIYGSQWEESGPKQGESRPDGNQPCTTGRRKTGEEKRVEEDNSGYWRAFHFKRNPRNRRN